MINVFTCQRSLNLDTNEANIDVFGIQTVNVKTKRSFAFVFKMEQKN